MYWTHDNRSGMAVQVLAIDQTEIPVLKRAVKQSLKKLYKAQSKLMDIHDSGEATESQETKRIYLEEEIEILEQFLKM